MGPNKTISKLYSIEELRSGAIKEIPTTSGVYFVFMPPEFEIRIKETIDGSNLEPFSVAELLESSKHYEMKEPLKSHLLYIGESKNLNDRIKKYITLQTSHRGGRALWQLEDSEKLLFGYIQCPDKKESQHLEHTLLYSYNKIYSSYPFANRKF